MPEALGSLILEEPLTLSFALSWSGCAGPIFSFLSGFLFPYQPTRAGF